MAIHGILQHNLLVLPLQRWNDDGARVICRQLGFSDGEALSTCIFGPGTDLLMLGDVDCRGDEIDISQCTSSANGRNSWEEQTCTHDEDIAVRCRKYALLSLTKHSYIII